MKRLLGGLLACGALLFVGSSFADQHEGEKEEPNVAAPMEMYACNYNEGKGPADLDKATKDFNAWADKQKVTDYSAWTLVPYYFGDEQDFDVLWFGAAAKAAVLGRIQDTWLATGAKEAEGFADVMTCGTHAAYGVLTMKKPPKREDSSKLMVTFSDCKMSDGVTFDDLYMPMIEWGKYREEHGSKAGHWVFFPSFGGGQEKFDFKWATAYENLEDLGADWDQVNEGGWQKVNELFRGKVRCDSSRTYIATSRRQAADDDE